MAISTSMAKKVAILKILLPILLVLIPSKPLLSEARSIATAGQAVVPANATWPARGGFNDDIVDGGKRVVVFNSQGHTTTTMMARDPAAAAADADVNSFDCGDVAICNRRSDCRQCPGGCCTKTRCNYCGSCVYSCPSS